MVVPRIWTSTWRKTVLAALLLLALFGATLALDSRSTEGAPGDKLYWSDSGAGKIQRADLDGNNVEDVLTGLSGPGDLAIDPYAGKIYFTSALGIQRANLDGTGLEVAVSSVAAFQIALDPIRSKVYWTVYFDRIRRADYDGANVEDLVTMGFDFAGPFGIAVDASKGVLYWSDTQTIKRANLDGSGAAVARNTGFVGPIALSGQALVWIEYLPAGIGFQFCNSAMIEPSGASANEPTAITVGPDGIYWADNAEYCILGLGTPQGFPSIRRTAPGGSIDIVAGLSYASGVAIALADPPPLPTPTAGPLAVGGIARDSGLAPLPAAEESGGTATPWVPFALSGAAFAVGAAAYARRLAVR